ncbi:putative serine threonine protein kinase protein [Rosellinia necatrix]|uniref:Putative serine threonine protein kinase protein n=1 Tax=Rosellinia necatrix TaxID=77044 RepID=A0A1W2TL39_ROSNE|nr:putative serine threonine protein kinase protein [Rosellinia necatrix]
MATSEGAKAEQRRLGLEVATYFTSTLKYNFVGFAGIGRHGGALILRERATTTEGEASGQGQEQGQWKGEVEGRTLVIKYSHGRLASARDASDADEDLRNEHRVLTRLRGAEHIVQLVPMADCSLRIPGMSDGEGTYGRGGEGEGEGEVTDRGRRCPTFALEYLPGGTITKFRMRVRRHTKLTWLPSRLLWRIWLCMVRQCVAMAFPPDIPEERYVAGNLTRETLKPRPYTNLTQNSAHADNFMFGLESQIPGLEHEPKLPVLKLIDFGRGKIESERRSLRHLPNNPDEFGSRLNLFNASWVMMKVCCINIRENKPFDLVRPAVTYRWDGPEPGEMQTLAPAIFREHPTVDPQLRTLLVRLMPEYLSNTLPLEDVLRETATAVANKGEDDPTLYTPAGRELPIIESDDFIKELIQKVVYNAD